MPRPEPEKPSIGIPEGNPSPPLPGLFSFPPFAEKIITVANAYEIPPMALEAFLGHLGRALAVGKNTQLVEKFGKNGTPELRRGALLYRFSPSKELHTMINAALRERNASSFPPNILERAFLVLAFGRAEIGSHPTTITSVTSRVRSSANVDTDTIARLDEKVPEDFEGLDSFEGIWDFITEKYGDFRHLLDNIGVLIEQASSENRQRLYGSPMYHQWHQNELGRRRRQDQDDIKAVLRETFPDSLA